MGGWGGFTILVWFLGSDARLTGASLAAKKPLGNQKGGGLFFEEAESPPSGGQRSDGGVGRAGGAQRV